MAGARKLQKEIEVTLKKVQEGVEEFDEIWNKVYDADNQAHKEKHEADLKKEIKKLQRLRDQIKTWINGNEIKDKTELINARKAVEREMERFKVCEREMKTKAFSKEGLQANKLDPRERERNDVRDWVNNTVNALTVQLESYESELEGLLATGKKKSKPPPRATLLEEFISRHKQHLLRLEQTLRLVDNLVIEPGELENVKEWVDDYVSRCEDSPEDFEDVDGCYEEIMEQLETAVEVTAAAVPVAPKKDVKETPTAKAKTQVPKLPAVTEDDEAASPSEKKKSPTTPVAAKTVVAAVPPPPPKTAVASTPVAAATPAAPAAAAAAKEERSASTTPRETPASTPVREPAPAVAPPPRPFSAAAAAGIPAQPPALATATARPGAASPNWSTVAGQDASAFPTLGGGKADIAKKPFNAAAAAAAPANGAGPSKPAFSQAVVGGGAPSTPARPATTPPAPSSSDLDARFAEVTTAPYLDFGMDDSNTTMWGTSLQNVQLLNACASRSIPQPQDGTWAQYPMRATPPPVPIPPTYPTTKLPILETPTLFSKVDPEVLFFAFYYQPGTYQQYLAAHQLKSQSWRYHKVHRAWLSRNDDPTKQVSDKGDNGTCVYFDYNFVHDDNTAGWCYRIKPDFVFDQDALENELT